MLPQLESVMNPVEKISRFARNDNYKIAGNLIPSPSVAFRITSVRDLESGDSLPLLFLLKGFCYLCIYSILSPA
jgi:hypothetical protein